MPSRKFVFALFGLAIIAAGLSFKPYLLGANVQNFLSGLSRPSLACNSPELIAEFQTRFSTSLANWRHAVSQQQDGAKYLIGPHMMPTSLEDLAHVSLNIQTTVTLDQIGNQLSCQMIYDYGRQQENPSTYNFMLALDDNGHLTWQSVLQSPEPYKIP